MSSELFPGDLVKVIAYNEPLWRSEDPDIDDAVMDLSRSDILLVLASKTKNELVFVLARHSQVGYVNIGGLSGVIIT